MDQTQKSAGNTIKGWARFILGLALFVALVGLLAAGPTPPGAAGRMIERNISYDIQATALFYQDLDKMTDLQEDLNRRVKQARLDNGS